MTKTSVIVVGAGVSGLSCALALQRRGIDFHLFEAAAQVGGAAASFLRDNYLCETGPNTLQLSKPEAVQFLEEEGLLSSALNAAPRARRRYVVQQGRLVALPSSIFNFFLSDSLSFSSKLRFFKEWNVPPGIDGKETVGAFARRRFGKEFETELVDPFISGIFAGDPESLVAQYALPQLVEWEQEHGSVLRGLWKRKKVKGMRTGLVSWKEGLQGLAVAMAAKMGERVHLSSSVNWCQCQGGRFRVGIKGAEFEAEHLVVATDAAGAIKLLMPNFGEVSPLREIRHAPMAVVHLGFRRLDVGHALDGFGVLISRRRAIRTLGALFSSTLFPGRAPPRHILLTAFIGGMRDFKVMKSTDDELWQTAYRDLAPLLKFKRPPSFRNIVRWPLAIPQYEKDHSYTLDACELLEQTYPGLHLIGNYRGGISLPDCIINGSRLGANLCVGS